MAKELRGELRNNHPLAGYTSWRVGGKAKIFYKPADLADLQLFLQQLPTNVPIFWLGSGSNVLINDTGIDGAVIYTKSLNHIEELNAFTIQIEAGVTCASLAKYCTKHELIGGAFFAGIPGTIGGALAMNAGAFDNETWDNIISVVTIDRQGNLHVRAPQDFNIGYRKVSGPKNEWFISAQFSFTKGNPATINKQIKDLMLKRAASQPLGELTCGSVFRNPKNDYAARLIESCGLKGKQIGDAKVSEKHANFIINQGQATATDIKALIELIQTEVKKNYKVDLKLEVIIL